MSEVFVGSEKQERLNERLLKLGIKEADLVEKFVLGSGPGGQKVNKTSSTVFLQHVPSGIEVKCSETRSRALNRYHARVELCLRMEERVLGAASKRRQEIEKIRRQKRRRSRRQKQRMLEGKHHQSEKKQQRNSIEW